MSLPKSRNTQQKSCIRKVLEEATGPIGIQDIFRKCQKTLPKIGIATVYRSISSMLSAGEIQMVEIPGAGGGIRYELPLSLGHHHHFLCRSCSRAFPLEYCPVQGDFSNVIPPGFSVDDHELILYGYCDECAARNKKRSKKKGSVRS